MSLVKSCPLMDDWKSDAACRGRDPSIFFDPEHERVALAICSFCDVRDQCLELVTDGLPVGGVWAGLTELDREGLSNNRFLVGGRVILRTLDVVP
jgi:hypothetical protein